MPGYTRKIRVLILQAGLVLIHAVRPLKVQFVMSLQYEQLLDHFTEKGEGFQFNHGGELGHRYEAHLADLQSAGSVLDLHNDI